MNTSSVLDINNFRLIGINYKKTDTLLRGKYAINPEQYTTLLQNALASGINEIFVISTCNRTEIYGIASTTQQLAALVCESSNGDLETFTSIAYQHAGYEAVRHLFHLAAGLDSQILGDFEILGQIKTAVKQAKAHQCIGSFLERLVNSVLQSAKAIKTHTQLSGGSVSVSFAAVKWIKQHAADISSKNILLIGTGKIGRNTCQNMIDYLGTRNITLINRTDSRSEQLAAELGVKASPIADAGTEIARADIIVACTNANEAIIHSHHLEGFGQKLIIDLSVPCSLTTKAASLPGITLVNVDMLSKIKDETLEMRRLEVPKAEAIIDEHVKEFRQWCDMRKYVVVLKKVKNKLSDIHTSPAAISINIPVPGQKEKEQIQAVINLMAVKMRTQHTPGCHYIEAINDYMACYG